MLNAIGSLVAQVIFYTGYVASNFRAFYGVMALTVVVLSLEYLATSLMIPMAMGPGAVDSPIAVFWSHVAAALGLDAVMRTWLWLFFILLIARLALGYVLAVLTTWLGKQVHWTLSSKVFRHILLNEPLGRVYTRSVGYYITMAGDDTFKSGTIISSLLQATVGMATALVGLIVLYQFSATVFVGIFLFLLVNVVAIGLLLRHVVRLNNRSVHLSREISTTFVEALNSLRSLRSLKGEQLVARTYANTMGTYVRLLVEIDAIKTGVKTLPAVALLMFAVLVLRPSNEVSMSDAGLFAGTVIIIRVFASLGQLASAGSQLLTDIRAVKDIGVLVELAQEKQKAVVAFLPGHVRSVTLDDVSFGYGDSGRVLDGVSFCFAAGHSYAVVGPSGSGKSTLADLLLGLSTPESGNVLVNEGQLSLSDATHHFVLVEQQSKIFSTSVRENLLLGASAGDEELHDVLRIVNLDNMVRSLANGLDTQLTYLGENFSGGQCQRLGIARALLRKPDVLILDEATSALDPETRLEVVAKLRQHMRDGIIIFITHDPEISALADEVLFIKGPLAK